jgi:hypothetical protein
MTMTATAIALILAVLAGCASSGIARRAGDAPGLDVAVQPAGPPLRKVHYWSEYAGWRPLGADQLVIWQTEQVGYLVRVSQPCQGLQSANTIQLTTMRNEWVRSGIDSVKFSGGVPDRRDPRRGFSPKREGPRVGTASGGRMAARPG